jgi:2-keto-4-pentenoate hydratase/2-oxohepta-3-ene-1,7-dioic acid hydratase in catechol pathway
MKLATFRLSGRGEAIGIVDTSRSTVLDVSFASSTVHGEADPRYADMLTLIDAGDEAVQSLRDLDAAAPDEFRYGLDTVHLLAPLPLPRQIRDFSNSVQHMRDAPVGGARLKERLAGRSVANGLIAGSGPAPEIYHRQPIYYHSNRLNVVGTGAEVEWPSYCEYLDYELEIAMIVGRTGKNLDRETARDNIFGYTIFNDISARDAQMAEMVGNMGPAKGKSFDTGNVFGPWIVTRDELPDPTACAAEVRVNGALWARRDAGDMIHDFPAMLAFVSRSETIYAGEIFGSGTLGGCSGVEIDRWLQPGDTVTLTVEGIGSLHNRIVRA